VPVTKPPRRCSNGTTGCGPSLVCDLEHGHDSPWCRDSTYGDWQHLRPEQGVFGVQMTDPRRVKAYNADVIETFGEAHTRESPGLLAVLSPWSTP